MEKILNTRIISAFPGTGKSIFSQRSAKIVLDSDSSKFEKSNFPQNYINHIRYKMGAAHYICVSSHETVRNGLVEAELPFYLVYPDRKLKNEYLRQYELRSDTKEFIQLLTDNWDNWLEQMESQSHCTKIVLGKGDYLSNIWGRLPYDKHCVGITPTYMHS